jgi:hypothetical protein
MTTPRISACSTSPALPLLIAPAIAPAVLTIGKGSYGVLNAADGVCAVIGAVAVRRVKGVR